MHALERAVAQHFDTYYGYIDPDQTATLYMMRAQSLSNLDGLYSYYSLYPKYSHGFVATVPMYTPAGRECTGRMFRSTPTSAKAAARSCTGR